MALSHVPDPTRLIGQTAHWSLVLNEDQSLLGRYFCLLNRPEADPLALSPDETADLWEIARRGREVLSALWLPDHFNYAFLMNVDPQVHFHVIPRYKTRREFADGTFVDPHFGGHYGVGPARTLEADAFAEVVQAMRARF